MSRRLLPTMASIRHVDSRQPAGDRLDLDGVNRRHARNGKWLVEARVSGGLACRVSKEGMVREGWGISGRSTVNMKEMVETRLLSRLSTCKKKTGSVVNSSENRIEPVRVTFMKRKVKDPNQAILLDKTLSVERDLNESYLDKSFKRKNIDAEMISTKLKLLQCQQSDSKGLWKGIKNLQSLTSRAQLEKAKTTGIENNQIFFNFSFGQELLLILDTVQKEKHWPSFKLEHQSSIVNIDPFKCDIERISHPQNEKLIKSRPDTIINMSGISNSQHPSNARFKISARSTNRLTSYTWFDSHR